MGYVTKPIEEVASKFDGVVRLVRKDLAITAFGVQIFELPPNRRAPRHDESSTGQQELYVGLDGSGWIDVEGRRIDFGPRILVRVDAGTTRQAIAGSQGLTYLCVGGRPGAAYEPTQKFS
jgi:hypothetical protein